MAMGLREAARRKVAREIRYGNLTRKPCEVCGNHKTDAHHDDYSHPLDVRWLCQTHHTEAHHGPPTPPMPPRKPRVDRPDLIAQLDAIATKMRSCQLELHALEEERNALILSAIAEGMWPVDVARATGLTRGRINQIQTRAK